MQARKLIQEDELEALCDGDELTQARRAGLVFPGWLEGPLHFPPTYKFRHVLCRSTVHCTAPGCLDIWQMCNIRSVSMPASRSPDADACCRLGSSHAICPGG